MHNLLGCVLVTSPPTVASDEVTCGKSRPSRAKGPLALCILALSLTGCGLFPHSSREPFGGNSSQEAAARFVNPDDVQVFEDAEQLETMSPLTPRYCGRVFGQGWSSAGTKSYLQAEAAKLGANAIALIPRRRGAVSASAYWLDPARPKGTRYVKLRDCSEAVTSLQPEAISVYDSTESFDDVHAPDTWVVLGRVYFAPGPHNSWDVTDAMKTVAASEGANALVFLSGGDASEQAAYCIYYYPQEEASVEDWAVSASR